MPGRRCCAQSLPSALGALERPPARAGAAGHRAGLDFIPPGPLVVQRWRSCLGPGLSEDRGRSIEKGLMEPAALECRRLCGVKPRCQSEPRGSGEAALGRAAPFSRRLLSPQAAEAVCGQRAKSCRGLSPSWPWLCPGTDLTAFSCPGLVDF